MPFWTWLEGCAALLMRQNYIYILRLELVETKIYLSFFPWLLHLHTPCFLPISPNVLPLRPFCSHLILASHKCWSSLNPQALFIPYSASSAQGNSPVPLAIIIKIFRWFTNFYLQGRLLSVLQTCIIHKEIQIKFVISSLSPLRIQNVPVLPMFGEWHSCSSTNKSKHPWKS